MNTVVARKHVLRVLAEGIYAVCACANRSGGNFGWNRETRTLSFHPKLPPLHWRQGSIHSSGKNPKLSPLNYHGAYLPPLPLEGYKRRSGEAESISHWRIRALIPYVVTDQFSSRANEPEGKAGSLATWGDTVTRLCHPLVLSSTHGVEGATCRPPDRCEFKNNYDTYWHPSQQGYQNSACGGWSGARGTPHGC